MDGPADHAEHGARDEDEGDAEGRLELFGRNQWQREVDDEEDEEGDEAGCVDVGGDWEGVGEIAEFGADEGAEHDLDGCMIR